MNKIIAVFLWGWMVTPLVALAEADYYVAVNASKADLADGCNGAPAGCQKTSSIVRLAGGYKFTPVWGVEASYGSLGKVTIPAMGESKASGWELAVTDTMPITQALAWMLKFGLVRAKLDNGFINKSASSTQFSWAIGLQYDLNKDFSIRGLYENFSFIGDKVTGQTDVRLLSGGVIYRF